VFGKLNEKRFETLGKKGIVVDGMKYKPMKVVVEKEGKSNSWIKISITEGKNREIKKVMEYFGLKVTRLIRIGFGTFHLGKLPVGSVKEVPQNVVKSIFPSDKI